MADTKISELPVATAIASPDVAPIVQGGVTKQADVSLFVAFLSTNAVRVDASGSDTDGTFGDINKPFLTVQAAINAIEALNPIHDFPVIDIGNNNFGTENLTTSLKTLVIVGSDSGNRNNSPFGSITFTEETKDITFVLKDCNAKDGISAFAQAAPGTDGVFTVHLINAPIGDVYNSLVTSQGGVIVDGHGSSVIGSVGLFSTNATDEIRNIPKLEQLNLIDGSQPSISSCPSVILSLASGTATINMQDDISKIAGVIPAGVTVVLFSASIGISFPNSDPHIAGAGYWLAGVLTRSTG